MREKEIERIMVNGMKKLGGRAYKWTSPGNAGVPDRIVIFPGEPPVFVELKRAGGVPTTIQMAQMRRLEALGQRVEVVHGIVGLVKFFGAYGHPEIANDILASHGSGEEY